MTGALVHLGARVPETVRDRFSALARSRGRKAAALLREIVTEAAGADPQPLRPGAAHRMMLRLSEPARVALHAAAARNAVTPAAQGAMLLERALLGDAPVIGREADLLRGCYEALTLIRRVSTDEDVKALCRVKMSAIVRELER